ncbi:MAG: hypothetical protein ABH854_00455 [Candidatus Diapherotrites archaeon]|nr:hypothetical protein [Candidatus Micrarchaeota archaeon]MBU1939894.1 hypothetical protein [Candidatus Micrarchaeota archaeon]
MIELKNVEPWKRGVDAISSFISEGNFRFNDKGVHFRATDPSQIVLVDFTMDKSAFDGFIVEPTFAGVDIVELSKIMSRALPGDRMSMDLSDSEIKVNLHGDLKRAFKLPLIDVSDEEVTLPSHKFDATVIINARLLKEVLKDASLFGSAVILNVKGGKFSVEARGSAGTLNTDAEKTKSVDVQATKDVTSKYSLNFLANIVKEAAPEQKITMQLKTDAPMRVSYKIGNSEIQYYLAHMIL